MLYTSTEVSLVLLPAFPPFLVVHVVPRAACILRVHQVAAQSCSVLWWVTVRAELCPGCRLRCSRKRLMDEMKLKGVFTEANLEFQGKILERSGLGDETGLSDGIAAMKDGEVKTSLRAALDESEMVLYDVVEQLINKTGIDPQEVCSNLFALHGSAISWACSAINMLGGFCAGLSACILPLCTLVLPLLIVLACVHCCQMGAELGALLCRLTLWWCRAPALHPPHPWQP